MESLVNNCPTKEKDNLISRINNTRNELNQFIQNDAKGDAVRSRARWIEFGEKNSRYFLGLEKWYNNKEFIKSLKNTQEDLVTDQKLILEELVNFYEKLYLETKRNNCEPAYNLFYPKIDEKENMECEKPITESECFKALSELSNNKSPGLDGFSVEFFKAFWQDLKEIFLKCLHYSLVANQLCDSQHEGLITLIPKPGKNTMYISNYRPIALLNCIYKIISKVINYKIYGLLPKLVNYNQSGFIRGRNIGDNIRLLLILLTMQIVKKYLELYFP